MKKTMGLKQINRMVDLVKLLIIIAISLAIVAPIIFIASDEPWNALFNFFVGPFMTLRRFGNILEGACPLIFTALGVMLIFSVGQFSMIAEGAFFIGSIATMVVSLVVKLPIGVHALVCLIAAAVAGALAAFIPAALKGKWEVNEVVTSIMLNYVIQYFGVYLVTYKYGKKESSAVASEDLATTSLLPKILPGTNIHLGLLIALILCILLWYLLYRTSLGYKLRLTGNNQAFTNYVGINAPMFMILAQILGGAIAGLGGGVELLGMYRRFKWSASPGYGWTGIVVALLAKDNPLYVPIAAAFLAYINTGSNVMAMNSDVSNDLASVIQAVIMLLVAANALLAKWKQKLIAESAEKEEATKGIQHENGGEV